ncbi:hypothetical protein GUJ93_ZPchr0229g18749 [Zizania palustris]|uniref:Uncharacterized protein n=1 Tax=Zizania palustris TaxID=103762 RepID=A0A8J5RCZ0_ZIZPA|nr:hypothetical protein GUJ93_ZPchr0229g18749 [Zizania palustris]
MLPRRADQVADGHVVAASAAIHKSTTSSGRRGHERAESRVEMRGGVRRHHHLWSAPHDGGGAIPKAAATSSRPGAGA